MGNDQMSSEPTQILDNSIKPTITVQHNCENIFPAMLQDDLSRYEKQRLETELIISDLLADRGEDELTAKACNRILHLIRNT